jgi:uncharacterized protein (DUF2249 family)/hemerythrin-like domain-containing protein
MSTNVAAAPCELRSLSGAELSESVLTAFDALRLGESLTLLGEGDPAEVLHRLQTERRGTFEWSPLPPRGSGFRVELQRRPVERGARRAVTETLASDHDRLDALEGKAFLLLAGGDAAGAASAWAEFAFGLERHIRFEEEIVFPIFEEKSGFPQSHGPTSVMRAEHREIEKLLETIGRTFEGGGEVGGLRQALHELLGAHNMKEEHVLYPATDEHLDPDERDAVVARIQAT